MTEEDLEKEIGVHLTETPTIWLLDLNGVSISVDGDDANDIKERNEKYKEVRRFFFKFMTMENLLSKPSEGVNEDKDTYLMSPRPQLKLPQFLCC